MCRYKLFSFISHRTLLANLEFEFHDLSVSETWNSFARPSSENVNNPGYNVLSTKSQSQNGGVGLYIKTCLGPVPRPDLVSDSEEYETVLA